MSETLDIEFIEIDDDQSVAHLEAVEPLELAERAIRPTFTRLTVIPKGDSCSISKALIAGGQIGVTARSADVVPLYRSPAAPGLASSTGSRKCPVAEEQSRCRIELCPL